MDPFKYTINQVNFEESELQSEQDLSSFGNLYAFDSEFEDKKAEKPLQTKRFKEKSNNDPYYKRSRSALSELPDLNKESVDMDQNSLVSDKSSPGIDGEASSFKAFTETVEALALQKSVIGSSNITPASAEEVARAIAEAQAKMFASKPDVIASSSSQTASVEAEASIHSYSAKSTRTTSNSGDKNHSSNLSTRESPVNNTDIGSILIDSSNAKSVEINDLKIMPSAKCPMVTDTPTFGHLKDTQGHLPESHKRKAELVRISGSSIKHSQEVTHSVPSEVIRPGHLPTDVMSLVLPDAKDEISPRHSSEAMESSTNTFQKHISGAAETVPNIEKKDLGIEKPPEQFAEVADPTSADREVVNHDRNRKETDSADGSTSSGTEDKVLERDDDIESKNNPPSQSYSQILSNQIRGFFSQPNEPIQKIQAKGNNGKNGTTDDLTNQPLITTSTPMKPAVSKDTSELELPVVSNRVENQSFQEADSLNNISQISRVELASDFMKNEHDKVLKEKAKLEGQLEVLSLEARAAFKERAELQAKLAALTVSLKSQEHHAAELLKSRNSMSQSFEQMKIQRSRLEQAILDAQHLIEDKDSEIRSLQQELILINESNSNSSEKIRNTMGEVLNRDETIQNMKGKITELVVEYQTSNQNRLLAENEVKSLQSEVRSLLSAKDWYKEQLQQVQESRNDLQQQITKMQANTIAQTTTIERLKSENLRNKQYLSDAQQKSLQEKESLARHLETIEADMMEREAAYQQLQSQQKNMDFLIQNEEERAKYAPNSAVLEDLNEELRSIKNDLRRRQAQVAVLEHEQADLVKRLTLSQETILERDKSIEVLEQRLVDSEVQCKNVKDNLDQQTQEFQQLKGLHSTLEVELSAAKDEKQMFDKSLQMIRDDMVKVENNFKKMKSEVSSKSLELDAVIADKKKLKRTIEELENEREDQNKKMMRLQEVASVHMYKSDNQLMQQSPGAKLGQDVVNASSISVDHMEKLQHMQKDQASLENKVKELEATLNQKVEECDILRAESTIANASVKEMQESKSSLEKVVQLLTEEKADLEGSLAGIKVDQSALTDLSKANADLRNSYNQLQRDSHQEILMQRNKVSEVEAKLLELKSNVDGREEKLKSDIDSLDRQLAESEHGKMVMEKELSKLQMMSEESAKKEEEWQQLHQMLQLKVEMQQKQLEDRVAHQMLPLKSVSSEQHSDELQNNIPPDPHQSHEYVLLQEELKSTKLHVDQLMTVIEKLQRQNATPDQNREPDVEARAPCVSNAEVAVYQQKIAALQNQYQVTLGRLNVVEGELHQLREVSVNSHSKDEHLHLLHQQLISSKSHQQELQNQVSDVQSQYLNLKLDSIEMQIDPSADNVQYVNKEIYEIRHMVNNLKQPTSDKNKIPGHDVDQQLQQKGAEIQQYKEQLERLLLENEKVSKEQRDKITSLSEEIERAKNNHENEIERVVNERMLEGEKSKEIIGNLETESQAAMSKIKKLEGQLSLMEDQLKSKDEGYQLALEQFDQRYSELEKVKSRLEDQLQSLSIKDNEGQIQTYQEQIKITSNDLESALSQKMALEQEVQDLSQQIQMIKKESEMKIVDLESEVVSLRDQINENLKQLDFLLSEEPAPDAKAESEGEKSLENSSDLRLQGMIQHLNLKADLRERIEMELKVILHKEKKKMDDALKKLKGQLQQTEEQKDDLQEQLEDRRKDDEYYKNQSKDSQNQIQLLEKGMAMMMEKNAMLEENASKIEETIKLAAENEARLKDVTEARNILLSDLEVNRAEIKESKEREAALQMALNENASKMADLESRLASALELSAKVTESEEECRKMALELERERGRIAGLSLSHEALKDHTAALEASLAKQSGSAVEISSHAQDELLHKDQQVIILQGKLKELQIALDNERQAQKDSKKQLLTQKGSHVKLKRKLDATWSDYEQIRADLEQARTALEVATETLDKTRTSELEAVAKLEETKAENQQQKLECERLERQAKHSTEKMLTMEEKLKNLEWKVDQQTNENVSTAEQLKHSEERREIESENLRKTIQSQSKELGALRDELQVVKKDKLALQAKVAELKGALEASIAQAKLLSSWSNSNSLDSSSTKVSAGDNNKPKFDADKLENVLKDSDSKVESKPLTFLQATLSGLRGEINTLQNQVDDHTMAVQSSSKAWKELESQVQDLRELCKTSAAGRATSIAGQEKEPAIITTAMPPGVLPGQYLTSTPSSSPKHAS